MTIPSSSIAIIGGAISGCTVAAELIRAGHNVTVYERSQGRLEERGVGLTMRIPTLEELKNRDLIDYDFPYVPVWSRTYARPWLDKPSNDWPWDVYWKEPVAIHAAHWGVLYRNLRKRVPDAVYKQGVEIVNLVQSNDATVEVIMVDGSRESYDLVISADGYDSVGRRELFPDADQQLTNYFSWRGMIEEVDVPRPEIFEEDIVFFGYEGGHGFIYFVPSLEYGDGSGKRRLNWAFQEIITDKKVPGVPPDNDGNVQARTAPGAATPEQISYCRKYAREVFPSYFADIVDLTVQPFTQPIRDIGVPGYVSGRICLMGDAAIYARPHVGAGANKALEDALDFSDAFSEHNDIDSALRAWEERRNPLGQDLLELGRSLGKHIVTDTPDWYTLNQSNMTDWWDKVVENHFWFWTEDVANWHPTGGR